MFMNKTTVITLSDVVRRIDENVFVLKNVPLTGDERSKIFDRLRSDVQEAHSILSKIDHSRSDVASEETAATLDEALMVLNDNGYFGSIAQVEITTA